MLKNMKIRKKLIVSFLFSTLIALTASVVAVVFMVMNNNQANYTLKYHGFAQGDIGMLGMKFQQELSYIRDVIILKDYEKMKKVEEDFNKTKKEVDNYINTIGNLISSQSGEEIFNNLNSLLIKYHKIGEKIFELGLQNKADEAYEMFTNEGMEIVTQINKAIEEYSKIKQDLGYSAEKSMTYNSLSAIAITLIISAISFIFSVLIAIKISKDISFPVILMANVAEKISNGDLDVEINYSSKDEIGMLANFLKKSVFTLKSYINDLSNVLDNISNGNLNIATTENYQGSFFQIKKSLDNIIYSLNSVFFNINQSSEQVANSSKQMSEGAQALAEGATDQASSIQQLSASIDEISEKINNTALNASQVSKISNDSIVGVKQGSINMNQVVEAMSKINESTSEINKIIKTVENIASQTNLLALNASIEAARAGEAGRSFVVVANKVRDLAGQSSDAAKNTSILIESVVRNVETGTEIVFEAANSLSEIVEGSENITKLINEISSASNEQAMSISQITQGVDQIANVVQSNSATSQQSAASSQELSSQAQILKSLIKKFKLKSK